MANQTESPPAVFTYGRLALWLVLLLIVLSIGYAVWQVVANWSSIRV
jgi:TRAP-type mannitol/chloroaromatic compound transport system permease small subunit